MPTTLPVLTQTMDDYFLSTWTKIYADKAADNIMLGTPTWAMLKSRGCVTTQRGGYNVTDSMRYQLPTPFHPVKGQEMQAGETPTRTMGIWPFRNLAISVQRDLFDDSANLGEFKIRDYVQDRLDDAQDSLAQQFEIDLWTAFDATNISPAWVSLNDMIPNYSNRATGTYGGIARSNSWMQAKYFAFTGNIDIDYEDTLVNAYNTISANQEPPNLLVSDQTNYQAYERAAMATGQIIKGKGGIADLGFETLYFKGKEWFWTPNIAAGETRMLNTNHIKFVYNPVLWMQMTPWKDGQLNLYRVAQILCQGVLYSRQLRRHGLIYTNA